MPNARAAMLGEPLDREVDVLRRAFGLLRDRLPRGWTMTDSRDVSVAGQRADALVDLGATDGDKVTMVVECRRLLVPRDLPAVLARLEDLRGGIEGPSVPVVVARYLPASVRQLLEEKGISYLDATGNMRVTSTRPALFLGDRGADRDPWRGPGRPRGTLKGEPAARVVRALADYLPPMSVPELVRRSGASTGAAYRVVEFLQEQDLIGRGADGQIEAVDWRGTLQRWSQDYAFAASGPGRYLHPRGLSELQTALASPAGVSYVVTGTLAAQNWAAYAPPRLAMIYVEDPDRAAQAWDLREVDAGANVLLAVPDYNVVYDRMLELDGLNLAAPSQVAVDLLTGPGHNRSEAEHLLDWMRAHEPQWRR